MLMLIARAARSAAASRYRFARLAERAAFFPQSMAAASHAPRLGADRAAAGDLLLHRSSMAAPPPSMDAPPPAMDAPPPAPFPSLKDVSKPVGRVEFVAKEEDLESDETLWALYERWCKVFNQKRDRDEMVRRFDKFKDMVLRVHRTNNANLPYKLGINKFCDGKLMEMRANRDPDRLRLAKEVGNSCVLMKRDGRFLREVYADFRVVNGKLFVLIPEEEGQTLGYLKELPVEYQVAYGRLYADLPKGHELVIPNIEFIKRRYF